MTLSLYRNVGYYLPFVMA